jgi:hypothetical protein
MIAFDLASLSFGTSLLQRLQQFAPELSQRVRKCCLLLSKPFLPYFRDRAEEMMKCVTDSFKVLKSAAGYVAYDPQLGRIVTATDLSEMVARYRRMDRALPEILAQSRESLSGKKKPWWKLW